MTRHRSTLFITRASLVRRTSGFFMAGSLLTAAAAVSGGALAQPAPAAPQVPATAQRPAAPAKGCDAACVRENAQRAAQICAPRIEAQAPTDFDWMARPAASGIFQQADSPKEPDTVIRYRGDSIRFLSPQREWVRVTYECGFDVAKQAVSFVNVRLGRLDRAAGGDDRPTASTAPAQSRAATAAQRPAPRPPAVRKPRVGEPSEIEVQQVDPRRVIR